MVAWTMVVILVMDRIQLIQEILLNDLGKY